MDVGLVRGLAIVAALLPVNAAAGAAVLVKVDLSQQQMTVDVDGNRAHTWSVSTARPGYVTPTGSYAPLRMHRMWYSRKYDDAPMPHAIFYSGGYAVHGTTSVRMLGRPASHGCVRLAPGNAAILYALVQQHGMAGTRIVVHGVAPKVREPVVAQRGPAVPQQSRTAYSNRVAVTVNQPGLLSGLFGWSEQGAAAPPRAQKIYQAPVAANRPLRPLPVRPR